MSDYTTLVEKVEVSAQAMPVMGSLSYKTKSGVNIGLGLGAYLLNIKQINTQVRTYWQSDGYNNPGDQDMYSNTYNFATIVPAAEITAKAGGNISKSLSYFIGLDMLILGDVDFMIFETTSHYYPNGVSSNGKLINIKEGVSFGGTGFGLRAGLALKF